MVLFKAFGLLLVPSWSRPTESINFPKVLSCVLSIWSGISQNSPGKGTVVYQTPFSSSGVAAERHRMCPVTSQSCPGQRLLGYHGGPVWCPNLTARIPGLILSECLNVVCERQSRGGACLAFSGLIGSSNHHTRLSLMLVRERAEQNGRRTQCKGLRGMSEHLQENNAKFPSICSIRETQLGVLE